MSLVISSDAHIYIDMSVSSLDLKSLSTVIIIIFQIMNCS